MNIQQQLDYLGLRLINPGANKFTDKMKLQALENSMYILTNILNDAYISELETTDTGVTVTSGKAAFSVLDNSVLRGAEGILRIKNTNGLWAAMLDLMDLKRTQNTQLAGTTINPEAWVYAKNIRTIPTSLTSIQVDYLKEPSVLQFPFVVGQNVASPTDSFIFADSQGISEVDDHYNGCAVYSSTFDDVYICTDYVGATRIMTVSPSEAGEFGADTIKFIETKDHDHHLTNLENQTCDLNSTLHELMITIAEAECWKTGRNLPASISALNKAVGLLVKMNEEYEAPEGIGTEK